MNFNKEISMSNNPKRLKVDFPIEKISIFFLIAIGFVNMIILNLASLSRASISSGISAYVVIGGNFTVYVLTLVFFAILFKRKKIGFSEVFTKEINKIHAVQLVALLSAAFLIMLSVSLLTGLEALGNVKSGFLSSYAFGGLNFILQIATVVLIAPTVDGIVYRLIIMNKIKVKAGIKWGIIISSAVFALIQLYISGYNFYYSLLSSLVYAIIYEYTGSLKTSVSVNMIHNALMILMIDFVLRIKTLGVAEEAFKIPAIVALIICTSFLVWFCTVLSLKIKRNYDASLSKSEN